MSADEKDEASLLIPWDILLMKDSAIALFEFLYPEEDAPVTKEGCIQRFVEDGVKMNQQNRRFIQEQFYVGFDRKASSSVTHSEQGSNSGQDNLTQDDNAGAIESLQEQLLMLQHKISTMDPDRKRDIAEELRGLVPESLTELRPLDTTERNRLFRGVPRYDSFPPPLAKASGGAADLFQSAEVKKFVTKTIPKLQSQEIATLRFVFHILNRLYLRDLSDINEMSQELGKLVSILKDNLAHMTALQRDLTAQQLGLTSGLSGLEATDSFFTEEMLKKTEQLLKLKREVKNNRLFSGQGSRRARGRGPYRNFGHGHSRGGRNFHRGGWNSGSRGGSRFYPNNSNSSSGDGGHGGHY